MIATEPPQIKTCYDSTQSSFTYVQLFLLACGRTQHTATRNFAVGAPTKETHSPLQTAECNALLRTTTGEFVSSPERLPGKFSYSPPHKIHSPTEMLHIWGSQPVICFVSQVLPLTPINLATRLSFLFVVLQSSQEPLRLLPRLCQMARHQARVTEATELISDRHRSYCSSSRQFICAVDFVVMGCNHFKSDPVRVQSTSRLV